MKITDEQPMEVTFMDKENQKDKEYLKDKNVQNKEIKKLTDEELEKISGGWGPIIPELER